MRDALVAAVDTALVTNYPVAGVIPGSLRRRVIRKQLDMIIDDIVLGPDEAFKDFEPPNPSD